MTPDILAEYIAKAKAQVAMRYKPLGDAYKGVYPILSQKAKPQYKPDNRLVVNFAKYIVDTFNGFFIGNPVKTTCDETAIAEIVEQVQNMNDQDDNNAELAKLTSIYGKAYEMYFVTRNKTLGITYLPPTEAFMIYDEGVVENPLYFVHWYKNTDDEEVGSYSDATHIYYFKRNEGSYQITDSVPHNFDGVPAAEFIENDERQGIYESAMTLISGFNKALSEKANDVDYFADAYLKILGAKMDEADKLELRNQRIINLENIGGEQLVVEFMGKPNADETQEHLLTTMERLIYQICMVPNINDEKFGTSSGIAMQYKLLNTLNLFKAKQRKFESGMNRRWQLLFSHPLINGKVKADDWGKLRYRFTPNLPANALEEAQTAAQLSGIVSRQTQLETLSMVDNVQAELERIEEEEKAQPEPLDDFNAHEHEDDEENPEDDDERQS
ncbi:phage portal protein [Faecalibaculum rodentium]|uniref:phage portal protein n=2 Tax=Faecalibaculum rodentium TaxID=1702221 RepID=UPI002729836E|nr:phage portal protein [Faecalibaculum rodentium]